MSKKDVKIRFYNTLWFRLVLGVFVCAAVGVSLISTYLNQQMSDLMTASVSEVYAKLNDDVRQGKFYRYKTKPRAIPVIK